MKKRLKNWNLLLIYIYLHVQENSIIINKKIIIKSLNKY